MLSFANFKNLIVESHDHNMKAVTLTVVLQAMGAQCHKGFALLCFHFMRKFTNRKGFSHHTREGCAE